MTTRPSRPGSAVTRQRPGQSSTAGWAVLLLVFVVGVGGPSLLRDDVTGRPSRLPILYTPAIGTCLLVDGPAVTEVSSCGIPHNAEVTRSWEPGEPVPGQRVTATPGPPPPGTDPEPSACLDAKYVYLDSDATDATGFWRIVAPVVSGRLITAPSWSSDPEFGWRACIVGAIDQQLYTGTLRDGFTGAHRPAARFASCVGDRSMSAAATWTTCDKPHTIEVLGSFRTETVFEGSTFVGPPAADTLSTGCASVARSLTRASDPTYGGRLRVASELLLREAVMVHRPGDTTYSGSGYASVGKPWCFLEVVGPGVLSSTVIGLGDDPLPVD